MSRQPTARMPKAASLLAACVLGLSLASCDRADPVQAEIDRVSIGLDAISTSGGTPLPSVEQRRRVYEWSINRLTGRSGQRNAVESNIADPERELKPPHAGRQATNVPDPAPTNPPAVDSKNPGQAAAANLLLARGHAGLAEISAQEASRLEAVALGKIPAVRVALDQWLSLNASAEALALYDPAPEIARIESQIAERQRMADEQRAAKDRQLAVVRGIEQQADELTARARALREQEATLRASAAGQSEVRRLEILTEAARVRREADDLEKQAAERVAQAALEKPRADEMQARIDEYTMQAQLLGQERENVRKRGQDRAAAAQAARDEARNAAGRIAAAVSELETARKEADAPAEAAIRGYAQAAGAARKAVQNGPRESQAIAAVSAGNYQHLLGESHRTQAFGRAAVADILKAVAEARPPLPQRAEYATKAAEFARLAAESLEAARAAYEDARGSYSRGNAQSLADSMAALAGERAAPRPADDAAPADPPADESGASSGSAAAPAAAVSATAGSGERGVRAAIDRLLAASRAVDAATIKAMIHLDEAEARKVLETLIEVSEGPAKLNAAAQAAYGKSLRELVEASSVPSVRNSPMLGQLLQQTGQMSMLPGDLDSVSAADAVVEMQGEDRATVTMPGSDDDVSEPATMVFVLRGGEWKIDADSLLGQVGGAQGLAMLGQMVGPLKAMGGAFTTVHGKLTAGEYADADRMLMDLNKELMGAMMRSGGMGGPGGG